MKIPSQLLKTVGGKNPHNPRRRGGEGKYQKCKIFRRFQWKTKSGVRCKVSFDKKGRLMTLKNGKIKGGKE